jgi:DNA-directed RNA polymerase sigma subunit (sigma70/sigma32)
LADDPASRRRKFRVLSCELSVGETGLEPEAAQDKGDYTLEELTSMALETLPRRQREALRLLYGIGRRKVRVYRQAAEELGTTVQRVRHLEEKGLDGVRELLYSRGTRPSSRPPAAPAGGFGLTLYRRLEEKLAGLPVSEEKILRRRTGFGHASPAGVETAGDDAGMAAAEVRRLEGSARRRLSGEAKLILKILAGAERPR